MEWLLVQWIVGLFNMKIYQEQDIIQIEQMKEVEKEIEQLKSQVRKYLTMLTEIGVKVDKNRLLCEINRTSIINLKEQ